jgi:2-(1,2-epoxy-1,2-dihydrophenyl)acetyl-CoA isomerase
MAAAFRGASATAQAMAKRALNASLQSDLETMLTIEATSQAIALSGDYVTEAARRFAAKEPAQFQWPRAGAA